ncbi:universal stress protein [Natrialbaceae archaeon AArc-T1-2]|uniref:universal stress protein n=1 Tax=Natrialbaceae archaeon AArc-T1-2 TaxID=3053904 RepID=UPI00255A74BD|nr:universal stress protein [Natrialbaceae archaeon AArc-T1-2]WIV68720.1 universal stress protein [Natrialbaceae archaeon AArc-T1-2]
MSSYDRILVPTDGSAGSIAAMEEAVEIATRNDATVFVVRVVNTDETMLFPPEANREQLIEIYKERASDTTAETAAVVEDASIPVTSEVVEGVPHEAINDYAAENEIDLVVMGTRGRSGLERTLLGSVTEKTVRTATVPVLVVQD